MRGRSACWSTANHQDVVEVELWYVRHATSSQK
jgi:hypothetical protein